MNLRDNVPELWTAPQRRMIIGIVIALCFFGFLKLFFNNAYVSNPQPAVPSHANDLADRFDPNTADAATLAVLPLIGDKRAADIVAYRERFTREHPGQVAFNSVEDLMKIRGIGTATVDQIRPYLIFPSTQPTTRQ